ncbi:hypothetical protein TWF102_004608 [Orbilia oligospora]|uniref:Uncharacterized protein n=1 Tax=Orbilia oligospora TaxID=2813651 RepID=A0A7C8NEL8_ORBOL|nr:hypothetical protein TWF103_008038 [Orbilia oligospora]KAF3101309.1 hypothetical protein TWF706_005609 [Orbilia oligospora]KAF3102408.1 hypothetical protein TWF102_004608 [Orbilia oligospora]KAF3126015.1 hypothetical protein TWF594_001257 [Orbilia oligospora]
MLEYFTYRKFKKHREAAESGAKEVLDQKDENYFEGVVNSPEAQEVPLNDSVRTPATGSPSGSPADGPTPVASEAGAAPKKQTWKDTVSGYATGTYEKAKHVKVAEHLPSFLKREPKAEDAGKEKEPGSPTKKDKKASKDKKGKGKANKEDEEYFSNLTPEEKELHDALDALSLAAQDGRAFSLSSETRGILKDFTQILKDMINGVPTAYDDLTKLFETKSKQIETMFDEMPGFIKSLAKKLPGALGLGEKVAEEEAKNLAPGLAAQAATFGIPTLKQLVTKPGVVADTLKTVVNAIKLRFPGIALGTNVVISMALFVLLFVFWYCWKRGKEVRLEKERQEQEAEDARLVQSVLEEAPAVPATNPSTSATTTTNTAIDKVMEDQGSRASPPPGPSFTVPLPPNN